MLYINKNTRIIQNGGKLIIANLNNNSWLRTTKVYFDILKDEIEEKGEIDELLKYFGKSKEAENLKLLFNNLKKIGVIVNEDKYKNTVEKLHIVYLAPTNKCNLLCPHCLSSSNAQFNDILTTDELKKAISDIIDLNPEGISFTGGEPLLRHDIIDLIAFTRKNFKGLINLTTNGTLINQENVQGITQYINTIGISLDGYDEKSCSMIRGSSVFEKVMDSIKLLQKNNFTKIFLSMLNSKITTRNIKTFEELCEKLGVECIIRRFTPINRGWDNRNDIILDFNDEIPIIGDKKNLQCKICEPGKREFYIDYKGDIYPCALLTNHEFKMGNILDKKTSLNNIIANFTNSDVSKKIESYRPYNDKCKNCNVNLFCWSCLGNYLSTSKDPNIFNNRCAKNKKNLTRNLWNKEI